MIAVSGARCPHLLTCLNSRPADLRREIACRAHRDHSGREPQTISQPKVDCNSAQARSRAGANLSRREAILASGGVLAAGVCQPASSRATEQTGATRGELYEISQARSSNDESSRCTGRSRLDRQLYRSKQICVGRQRRSVAKLGSPSSGGHAQQWPSLHCLGAPHSTYCLLSYICRCGRF